MYIYVYCTYIYIMKPYYKLSYDIPIRSTIQFTTHDESYFVVPEWWGTWLKIRRASLMICFFRLCNPWELVVVSMAFKEVSSSKATPRWLFVTGVARPVCTWSTMTSWCCRCSMRSHCWTSKETHCFASIHLVNVQAKTLHCQYPHTTWTSVSGHGSAQLGGILTFLWSEVSGCPEVNTLIVFFEIKKNSLQSSRKWRSGTCFRRILASHKYTAHRQKTYLYIYIYKDMYT